MNEHLKQVFRSLIILMLLGIIPVFMSIGIIEYMMTLDVSINLLPNYDFKSFLFGSIWGLTCFYILGVFIGVYEEYKKSKRGVEK